MLCDLSPFFDTAVVPGVGEVVVAIDIFQKRTVFNVSDAACGACRIKSVCRLISLFVEFIIILGLINSNAPDNNGRMISILENHFFGIDDGFFLPFFISDMLPAWNLSEYQETKSIAL